MALMIRDENDWGGFRNCEVGDEGRFYRAGYKREKWSQSTKDLTETFFYFYFYRELGAATSLKRA